jgi:hypothetical protein
MKRKTVLLEHVPVAARLASVSLALLLLAACSSVHSASDAVAGQAPSGAAASNGSSGAAQGGSAQAGSDGLSGAAGARAPSGGASNGGASVAGAANTAGNSNAGLGADCELNSDCSPGLMCLPATSSEFDGGGPAHGLCTASCANDTICTQLEAGAGCFSVGQSAYCLQACSLGDDSDLANKCHGRPDFACAELEAGAFCVPMCRADVECGPDRFCNRARGLCEKTKSVGDPVGAACTPSETTSTCLGTCLRTSADGVTPVTGVCVELCAGGLECMWDDAGTKPGGFCAGQLSDSFAPIDIGYCLPSCDCSGSCPLFGSMCRAWTDAESELKAVLGKPGVCFDNVEGSSELTCK